MAVAVRSPDGALKSSDELVRTWKDRIQRAKDARKPLEKIWLSNLAFAAGQHWLVYDNNQRTMRHVADMDPRYADRVLYTADRINEYVQAQMGELSTGDDRPELLTAQDGDNAEETANALNHAVAHAWEHEWNADKALTRARSYCLKMGTAAIRCRRDPNYGAVVGHAPLGPNGRPADQETLAYLQKNGTLPDGSLPKFREVREGRTILEPFTALQILTPAGITHEDDLPWEILVRPVLLTDLQAEYPAAKNLVEDSDIASATGLATGQQIIGTGGTGPDRGRLREHVWLYTCYERPCRKYPDGQVVVIASNQYQLLDVEQQLPYTSADGATRKTGISYFHWWRLDDRFNSRAMIEPLKDPQRALNESKTIKREILVRGLPKIIVKEGAVPNKPTGVPAEILELKDTGDAPIVFPGFGPGPWWDADLAEAEADLSHASTLTPLRLGENPQHVDTYSQLALLNENEALKRTPIKTEHDAAIADLVECGVQDIRRFWPEEKTIAVLGDDGSLSQQEFRKATIPDFFQVKTARGAAQPRSQAAELKKVDAIWAAAIASGLAVQDAERWTRWYADSLEAGEAQELPEVERDSQERMAAYENFLMLRGEQVDVADYDLAPAHIPVHREAQDQARAAGDMEAYGRIAAHVAQHVQMGQANAAQVAAAQQAASPFGPPPPDEPGAAGVPVGPGPQPSPLPPAAAPVV